MGFVALKGTKSVSGLWNAEIMGTVVSAKYTLELSCPESRGRRNGDLPPT